MLHNLTGSAKVINIVNSTVMAGKEGLTATVELPSFNGKSSRWFDVISMEFFGSNSRRLSRGVESRPM